MSIFRSIEQIRYGFLGEGGASLMYTDCTLSSWAEVVYFVFVISLIAVFAPFPEQWISPGTTGFMRVFSGLEMFAVYLLMPYAIIGGARLIRKQPVIGWFMVAFALGYAVLSAVGIPNVGSLFRIRMVAVECMIFFAAIGFYDEAIAQD